MAMKKRIVCFFALICSLNINAQSVVKMSINDVQELINSKDDGTVLILNFWATFCKPCVAEIPDFISITAAEKSQKVKLILISLDDKNAYPKKLRAFARRNHFANNLAWLNETDADSFLPKIDPSWSGSIPATLFINKKTGARKFVEGEMNAIEFKKALVEIIN